MQARDVATPATFPPFQLALSAICSSSFLGRDERSNVHGQGWGWGMVEDVLRGDLFVYIGLCQVWVLGRTTSQLALNHKSRLWC